MGWIPVILFMIIGFAALVLFQFPKRQFPLACMAVFSYFLGIVCVTGSMSVASVFTHKLHFFFFWLLFVASVGVLIWKRKDARAFFPEKVSPPVKSDYIKLLAISPLLAIILFNIFIALQINMQFPIVGFDALGNFAIRGKLWFYTHDLFPEQLKNPEYIMFKRTYPPLISMTEALWNYILSPGEWSGYIIKWFFVGCWISVGVLVYTAVYRREGWYVAWLACTVWFLIPFNFTGNEDGGLNGYGDMPMGMGFVIAALLLDDLKKAKKLKTIFIISLMVAGIILIKRESLPYILLIAGTLVLKRTCFKTLGMMASLSLLFYIVIKLMTKDLPTHLEYLTKFNLTSEQFSERLDQVWPSAWKILMSEHIWGERLWLAFIIVWVFKIVKGPWKKIISWELLYVFCMGSLYLVVLFFTYFEFERNFEFVADRLYFQLYPLLIIATFTGFNLKFEQAVDDQQRQEVL